MQLSLLALTASVVSGALSLPGSSLKYEHAGGVFSKPHSFGGCVGGVLHDVEPRGSTKVYDGETIYATSPPGRYGHGNSSAVIYVTDIFGLGIPNNKLLADSLASAGYTVFVPDIFRGDPVPGDGLEEGSTFDFAAWQAAHPPSIATEIIESTLNTISSEFAFEKLGAVGYCYGGPFVAQLLAADGPLGGQVEAGFTAHPSGVTEDLWDGIEKPISVAYGALDASNNITSRYAAEEVLVGENKTFETSLYAGAPHGFAVRANLSDPLQAFAQESAYFQAVEWLDTHVKA